MTLSDLLAASYQDLGPDKCWLWTKCATAKGYGQTFFEGKLWYTHRLAWTLTHGPIPQGMNVLHNCPSGDNPRCFNPAHLWLGTLAQNNQDMAKKGRAASGDRTGPRLHPERMKRGEQRRDSKLTDEAVREIRAVWGVMATGRELAKEYGVKEMCISSVVSRKHWRHVRYEE